MEPINVLSLFDGISCGRVALERANIPVAKYYASEIDKYAIQVTQKNWPDTIQLGDVKNVWARNLPKIDLLIGGSPCQDLSIAKQNRKGLAGQRSGLFWHYVRLLRTTKPKYFLLENVASMSKADKDKITEILGVEPVLINSALVSAQQRKRLYWTNIPNITQPEDKGILLKDILETGIPYLKKSESLTASYDGAVFWNSIQKHQRTMVAEPTFKEPNLAHYLREYGSKGKILYDAEKSPTLTAAMGAGGGNIPCVATDEPVRIGNLEGLGKGQANRIYSVRGKSVCLNANGGGGGAKTGLYKIDLPDGDYTIRKLTPLECERLQTLPDNYTDGISNSQRYKCIGNGWTCDVIAHIFSFLKENL